MQNSQTLQQFLSLLYDWQLQFECLHINFAKNVYRASNHKDEYYQMIKWLERREKV